MMRCFRKKHKVSLQAAIVSDIVQHNHSRACKKTLESIHQPPSSFEYQLVAFSRSNGATFQQRPQALQRLPRALTTCHLCARNPQSFFLIWPPSIPGLTIDHALSRGSPGRHSEESKQQCQYRFECRIQLQRREEALPTIGARKERVMLTTRTFAA